MEIHAHGFLLLGVFFWRGLSSILRGILRWSISGSQPLVIDLRHWPQIWRRASFVLSFAAVFHQLCREGRTTQERAEAATLLAKEQGFPDWMAFGSILYGWALAHQGQAKEGIEQLHQGFIAHRATGAEILRPYWLALLAEAHGTLGEPEAGLTVLTEALTHA